MPKALLLSSNGNNSVPMGTYYSFYNDIVFGWFTTESDTSITNRSSGTFSNLWMNIIANNSTTQTVTFRNNSVNGAQTFSIGATTTGTFTDSSHTDAVVAGDLSNISITGASSTTTNASVLGIIFAATSNTVCRVGSLHSFVYTAASTTNYLSPFGGMASASANTTEARAKNRQRKAGTYKNLEVNVPTGGNTSTNASTLRSRKNGANGKLTISIAGSTSGIMEDTTPAHSDSVAPGDDFNYSYTTGTGTCNCILSKLYVDFVSTNQDGILSAAEDLTVSVNTASTKYFGLAGSLDFPLATETNIQVLVNEIFTFSELTINVQTNGISNASTITLRANGASAGVAASIADNATGVFSDSINTYVSDPADLMDYELVTASTGTSMSISHISVWPNSTPVTPPLPSTGFPLSIRHLPTRAGYQSFGSEAPVFGVGI